MKIAVIVEEEAIQNYINLLLTGEGYEVKTFSTQNEAIEYLDQELVDLVISDFQSPNINGLDLCKVLRKNFFYNLIPMFFLIPDTKPLNAAKLIYAGADDYLKRSLIQEELFLKVKLILYRMARQKDINSVTKLPGQSHLVKELQKRITLKKPLTISYLELSNLEEFDYRYGFKKGNEVIAYAASLIFKKLNERLDPLNFLAHVQRNEFVFLTHPETADATASEIIAQFDQDIAAFYDEKDRENRYIVIKNRNGQARRAPFVRIRMSLASYTYFSLFTPVRMIQISREIKDSARTSEKSICTNEENTRYAF